jgi:flavin-dependent dehydrogenase
MEPVPEGARLYFRTAEAKTAAITAATVVGADGIGSEVAGAAHIKQATTAPLVQAEIHLPDGWPPRLTQVWLDSTRTRYFFWLVPESDERGVVGLIGDGRARVNEVLRDFMARLGLKPLRYQAGTVALHHPKLKPWGRVGVATVLLVGDAAEVTTVGGTVSGLLGAGAAARSILQGSSYDEELQEVRRELNLHWYIRAVLDRLDNMAYDSLVKSVTPVVAKYLGEHNRDELAPTFWRLLLFEPMLAAGLIRSLLKFPARADVAEGSIPSLE